MLALTAHCQASFQVSAAPSYISTVSNGYVIRGAPDSDSLRSFRFSSAACHISWHKRNATSGEHGGRGRQPLLENQRHQIARAGVLDVGAGRAGDLWELGDGDDLPARFDLSNDRRLRAAVVVADTGQADPSWLI